jgi:uncharacterized protein YceK
MNMRMTVVLMTVIALTGCTSMRAMDLSQADFAAQLETGDHLVITEKGGRIVDMTFAQVDGNTLVGSQRNSGLNTVEVEIDQILQIEIEKISGAKTTGAVIGGIVLVPIVAAGAVLMVMAGG